MGGTFFLCDKRMTRRWRDEPWFWYSKQSGLREGICVICVARVCARSCHTNVAYPPFRSPPLRSARQLCSPYAGANPSPIVDKSSAPMGPGILSSVGAGVLRRLLGHLKTPTMYWIHCSLRSSSSLLQLTGGILFEIPTPTYKAKIWTKIWFPDCQFASFWSIWGHILSRCLFICLPCMWGMGVASVFLIDSQFLTINSQWAD